MIRLRASLVLPLLVLPVLALAAACGGGGAKELQVFTWSDYLDPDVVAEFERETGAKVVESNFSSNEEMRAKLQAGGGGYDLVCPTDYAVTQLVQDGLLQRIDAAQVPNRKHLGARFKSPAYDPDGAWSVPFRWGVTGIGWDAGKVADPPKSWRAFFAAAAEGKLGKVSLLDDQREVLGAALLALGKSPNSRDPQDIAAAKALVAAAKPNVAKFDSDDPATSLAQGETVLAQGWSGQFANGHRDDPRVSFVVPSEGALTYVDNWSIPKGAPHPELAHAFLNFLLRPEVAAKLVNGNLYASVNETAKASIDPEIVAGIAYSDGGGVKLWWVEDVGPAGDLYADAWRDLKAE